jgi:DNA-binding CsgD family transcriptional regulator
MAAVQKESAFHDLIYEAALEPEKWPEVLGNFSRLLGGNTANVLFQHQITGAGRGLLHGVEPATFRPYFGHFATRNPLLRITDLPVGLRVLTDEDKLPKEDFVRTEYYNDFLRSIDGHSVLMLRLAIEGDQTTVLNVLRHGRKPSFGRSDVDNAKRFHQHLVRAYRLSSKLSNMNEMRSGFQALFEHSACALFVVDALARVRHANASAERLIAAGLGLSVQQGKLRATDANATRKLHALIGAANDSDSDRRTGGVMALSSPTRQKPASVSVTPARSEGAVLFDRQPFALVCVTDPEMGAGSCEEQLRAVFALSPAEARTAAQLLAGNSLRQAAEELHLSYNTLRVHLSRIFFKTGTHSQSDLMRLMSSLIR